MVNLKHLKEEIETLSLQQQMFIGRMFYDENISMFENKNGVFINLTEVDPLLLEKIHIHLQQIREQEQSLNQLEIKKQQYKDNFFSNLNEGCE